MKQFWLTTVSRRIVTGKQSIPHRSIKMDLSKKLDDLRLACDSSQAVDEREQPIFKNFAGRERLERFFSIIVNAPSDLFIDYDQSFAVFEDIMKKAPAESAFRKVYSNGIPMEMIKQYLPEPKEYQFMRMDLESSVRALEWHERRFLTDLVEEDPDATLWDEAELQPIRKFFLDHPKRNEGFRKAVKTVEESFKSNYKSGPTFLG